ncbi:MAG: geranylgeranyl reductase family protein [Candidatus Micrarchaeia archaeon]
MYDVHVIGAGPAGSFAAYTAAARGAKVLISEEHPQVGAPVACSGLVSKSGLEEMSDLVNYRKITLNTIHGAIVYAGKERFEIRAQEGEKAHLIDRGAFDSLACESAVGQGARLSLSDHVGPGKYAAGCIIGADGPNSTTATVFGFPRIRNFVITMQADFEMDVEDARMVTAFLDKQDFPGFFGWVIPKGDGSAKVGMGARLPSDIKKRFDSFQKRLGIDGKKPENLVAAIIPVEMRKRTAMEKGGRKIMLAGDAAGQVKATTGGGIYFGASCGRLAGLYYNEPARYEAEWQSQYGNDLSMHGWIYQAMHGFGGRHHSAASRMLKCLGAENFLGRFGEMDKVSKTFNLKNIARHITKK